METAMRWVTWREEKGKTALMQMEDNAPKQDGNSETEKDHYEEELNLHLNWLWGVKKV